MSRVRAANLQCRCRHVCAVVRGRHHVFPGVGETLPAHSHHVRDDAEPIILNFIRDTAADIASSREYFRAELMLNVERQLIRLVRLKLRVKGLASPRADVLDAWIPRMT